jgi:hypothetical protein
MQQRGTAIPSLSRHSMHEDIIIADIQLALLTDN